MSMTPFLCKLRATFDLPFLRMPPGCAYSLYRLLLMFVLAADELIASLIDSAVVPVLRLCAQESIIKDPPIIEDFEGAARVSSLIFKAATPDYFTDKLLVP